jgi:hypothetical protein
MLKTLSIIVVVTVAGWAIAGTTASLGIASLMGGQSVMAKTSVSRAAPEMTVAPAREAPAPREVWPAVVSLEVPSPIRSDLRRGKADFDRAFADVALPRRDNTPANREKLRAAGWKRLIASR